MVCSNIRAIFVLALFLYAVESQTVTGVAPSTGNTGDIITISGSAFGVSTGTLKIGGTVVTPLSWADTSITFVASPVVGTSLSVIVTTSSGSSSAATGVANFTFLGTPSQPAPGWCGSAFPSPAPNNNTSSCGPQIAAIDPLKLPGSAVPSTPFFGSDSSIQFPFQVCNLNPQGYVCSGGYGASCTSTCVSATSFVNSTGRGARSVVLNFTYSNGTIVPPSTSCQYGLTTALTASSCVGNCANPTLNVPPAASLSACGFTSSTSGGNTVQTGYVLATTTEYFQDIASGLPVPRQIKENFLYSIAFPNTLTLTLSGITVYAPVTMSAQIKRSTLTTNPTPAKAQVDILVSLPPFVNVTATTATSTDPVNWAITLSNPTANCNSSSSSSTCFIDPYSLVLTAPAGSCAWNSSILYSVNMTLGCKAGVSCPYTAPAIAIAQFSFSSTFFCPSPLNVVPASGTLQTFTDATYTTQTNAFFTGTTIYGSVKSFSATSSNGGAVSISAVSLQSSQVTYTVGSTSLAKAATVISCTTAQCKFSLPVPTDAVFTPATNSYVTVTLSATFFLNYTQSSRRRDEPLTQTVALSQATIFNLYGPETGPTTGTTTGTSGNSSSAGSPLVSSWLWMILALATVVYYVL